MRITCGYQPTETEMRMLALVAEGHTQYTIAREIGTSQTAVAMGLSRLYARLGAINAPHAIAIRTGLLPREVRR